MKGESTRPDDGVRDPRREDILAQLDAIARAPSFAAAPRKIQLLNYLVQRALSGETVNEYAIGVDVFERPASFRPGEDSIVRTELTRLRQKLKHYYSAEGLHDAVRIDLPLRSYVPVFVASPPQDEPGGHQSPEFDPAGAPAIRRRWPMYVAVAAAGVGLAAMWSWNSQHTRAETPSLAILPFLNLTGNSSQEFLSDGITDELTETLAETSGMRVVARTSSFQFKGKPLDIREIGQRLNVGAILEGSVRSSGGGLEVVVQLVGTNDGYHIWSRTFTTSEQDLRQMETEIGVSVRHALRPSAAAPASLARSGTTNPEAHDLYLRAAYDFYQADPNHVRSALALARQAVALDPSFVRAHWLIVKAERNLASMGQQSAKDADAHCAENLKAVLALDPGSPDAHAAVAFRAYVQGWDWPEAEAGFRTALSGGGSAANARNLYGWCLMTRGRFAEAHRQFEAALEIDPMAQSGARVNSAVAWILEHKYEPARQAAGSILQINPNSVPALGLLAWIASADRDCGALGGLEKRWWQLVPQERGLVNPVWEAGCGFAEQARKRAAELTDKSSPHYIAPYVAAETYGILGDGQRTLEFLNKAAEERSDMVLYLQSDPLLDSVRNDAGIQALANRIGLPKT